MKLFILTPEKQLFSGDVTSVMVPGTSGKFQILKGHAPIVSSLEKGAVKVVDTKGVEHVFEILKGFVEVLKDEVSVLAQPVKKEE